jgi:WD40 repeat protein
LHGLYPAALLSRNAPAGEQLESDLELLRMVGWDLGGEGPLAKHTLWGHGDRVDDVPFSPDGTPLGDRRVGRDREALEDVDRGGGQVFAGHVGGVLSVAFSPDGSRLGRLARTARRGCGTCRAVGNCSRSKTPCSD